MKILSIVSALVAIHTTALAKQKGPTFVLVHGALLSSSSWASVQNHLQNEGMNVVTLDVPGRAGDITPFDQISLQLAARKVCKVANLQTEPVILVGHSQGGALITQTTEYCRNQIKALVYISAVVPKDGETAFVDLTAEDNANFDRCATYDDKEKVFRVNRSGPLQEMFMADLPPERAQAAIINMVSEPARIGSEPLKFDEKKFQQIPKYYIETTEDRILSIHTQRNIQSKAQWKKTYTLRASHSPFLSQPKETFNILRDIYQVEFHTNK